MSLQEVAEIIDNEFERIQNGNEVYASVPITKRDSYKIYCKYECSCYAYKFIKLLKDIGFDGKIYLFRVTGGTSGVQIRRHKNEGRTTRYDYHVAIILVDREGKMIVIDPIMFGNSDMRELSFWYENIIESPHRRFTVSEYF